MSYYTVTVNEINVLGIIWQGIECAQNITLRDYDIENIKARGDGELTRDAVEQWLCLNTGDFQYITDFRADIGDFLSEWDEEESEYKYFDAMYPELAE